MQRHDALQLSVGTDRIDGANDRRSARRALRPQFVGFQYRDEFSASRPRAFRDRGTLLGEIVETGGHAASLASLARGETDIAAIDCVSYALLARHRPELAGKTRILDRTAQSPTLPFVTGRAQPLATIRALREALAATIADPALAASRAALFLTGMAPADPADYGILLDYQDRAANLGYPLLA